MRRLKVAVVGGGPAGLSAALSLAAGPVDVHVFEASAVLGGLARSISLWGQRVDLGPHVVTGGSPDAVALWDALVGADSRQLCVRRGVLSNGRIIEYPLRASALLRKLPIVTLVRCATGLVLARGWEGLRVGAGPRDRDSEAWVIRRFGRALYDTLFRHYVEKLWGRPGTAVDASFARALVGATRSVPDRVRPGVDRCRHPKNGTGAVWDAMAATIEASGGTIHRNAPVRSIVVDHGQIVGLDIGGELRRFDHVHSTIPLRHLVQAIDAPPPVRQAAASLDARHVVLAHLLVASAPPLEHLWVQIYDPDLRVGRITDSAAWNPESRGKPRVITMEYWCGDGDDTWLARDEEVLRLAAHDLAGSGLLPGAEVQAGQLTRLRGALPVPSLGYADQLAEVHEHCAAIRGLSTAGRHGTHALSSVIDNIDDGLRAAHRIADAAARLQVRTGA